MIGRVEETSASFEARSAPRLYPTEGLGVQFPGPTRRGRRCSTTHICFSSTSVSGPSGGLADGSLAGQLQTHSPSKVAFHSVTTRPSPSRLPGWNNRGPNVRRSWDGLQSLLKKRFHGWQVPLAND